MRGRSESWIYRRLGLEGFVIAGVLLIALWSIFWKGIGLWKSARNGQKYWFIAILLINSVGILPILYIYVFKEGEKGIG